MPAKKKKSGKKKLAKMTEEEKLLYLEQKRLAEEEMKKKKEDMLTQFLKVRFAMVTCLCVLKQPWRSMNTWLLKDLHTQTDKYFFRIFRLDNCKVMCICIKFVVFQDKLAKEEKSTKFNLNKLQNQWRVIMREGMFQGLIIFWWVRNYYY